MGSIPEFTAGVFRLMWRTLGALGTIAVMLAGIMALEDMERWTKLFWGGGR